MSEPRKLRVFLCHASQDKPVIRELYQRLLAEGWIDPWLDEERLLPGQEWDVEIEKAVEAADVVIVCASSRSVTKEGYVQRELKFAMDIALEKPEGTIFIIPLRLDDCDLPRRLRSWQYDDYFPAEKRKSSYQRLLQSLNLRYGQLTSKEDGEIKPQPLEIKPAQSIKEKILTMPLSTAPIELRDMAGTIFMILFLVTNAIFSLSNGGSQIMIMAGTFALAAGAFFGYRREIHHNILVRLAFIAFLLTHSALTYVKYNGWDMPIEIAYLVEGVLSLGGIGILFAKIRSLRVPAFYASISFAIFLLFTGLKLILNGLDQYPDFVYFPIILAGIATAILIWFEM